MDEEQEIIKGQLKRIPEGLRKYVSSASWSEEVAKKARQHNLTEEKSVNLENEVLFVLICLEPPQDFKENIKREVGLDDNTAQRINDSMNGSVFSPVMSDIKSYWADVIKEEVTQPAPVAPANPPIQPIKQQQPPIKSYDSFEKTILRQAQAMRPAQSANTPKPIPAPPPNLPGATAHTTPVTSIPVDLSPKIEKRDIGTQYSNKNDPYREPIE